MPFDGPASAAIVAAAVSLLATPFLIPVMARWLRQDVPGDRSSHTVITPRGGGMIVAIGVVVGWVTHLPPERVLISAGVMAIVYGSIGLVDDLRPLGATVRLGAQGGVALIGLIWLVEIGPSGFAGVAFCAGALVTIVGFVNAFNFMDGINGISSLHGGAAGIGSAIVASRVGADDVAVFAAAVGGGALAFLWPNLRRRPLIFLGDVGSYFLGACIATVALLVWRSGATIEAAAAPMAIYVVDTGTTMLRRAARGDDVFAAHREHVYQRITPPGTSHARTALIVVAFTVALSALGIVSLEASTTVRLVLLVAWAAVITSYLALPLAFNRPDQSEGITS